MTYENNKNAGDARVVIIGKGNFTGKKEAYFTIEKTSQSIEIELSKYDIYTGDTVTVITKGAKTDILYQSNNPSVAKVDENGVVTASGVGDVTITATAVETINYYPTSENVSFHIYEADITEATVIFPQFSYDYNGHEQKPDVEIRFAGNILKKDTDYQIDYFNNIDAGTANMSIHGIGNYCGFTSADYIIHKAKLTIYADSLQKIKGEDDPYLTYRVEGLKGADKEEDILHNDLERDEGEEVGIYTIRQGTLTCDDDSNYEIEKFVEGKLTIKPADTEYNQDDPDNPDNPNDQENEDGMGKTAAYNCISLTAYTDEHGYISLFFLQNMPDTIVCDEKEYVLENTASSGATKNFVNDDIGIFKYANGADRETLIVKYKLLDSGSVRELNNIHFKMEVAESSDDKKMVFDQTITVPNMLMERQTAHITANSRQDFSVGTGVEQILYFTPTTTGNYTLSFSNGTDIAYMIFDDDEYQDVDNFSEKGEIRAESEKSFPLIAGHRYGIHIYVSSNMHKEMKYIYDEKEVSLLIKKVAEISASSGSSSSESASSSNRSSISSSAASGNGSSSGTRGTSQTAPSSGISSGVRSTPTTTSGSGSSSSSGNSGNSSDSFSKGDTRSSGKGASKADYKKSSETAVKYKSAGIGKTATTASVPATAKIRGKTYNVTVVAANAFSGLSNLKTVTIGKNIKKIGKSAFSGCKNLTTLVIRSKNLTEKSIRNALKGSSVKTVIVPADKVEAYQKIFTKKNTGSKNEITVKAGKTTIITVKKQKAKKR